MLENQIPVPPVDMVMSPYNGAVIAASFTVLAGVLFWVVGECRRSGRLLPLFIVLGGSASSLLECLFDHFILVWYPQYGHTPLYRMANISMPVWILAGYSIYSGGMGYFMYKKISAGITSKQLWALYFFLWVANMAIELPVILLGNNYVYYGNQPFMILGFPLWMAMVNAQMPILAGAVFTGLDELLRGPRSLMAIAIVPMIAGTAQISVGWPIWLALNSGVGYGVTTAAGLVAFGFSLMITYLVSAKFCQPATAALASSRGGKAAFG